MENMLASYWRIFVYIFVMVTAKSNAQEDILRNTLLSITHPPRDVSEPELYNPDFYLQSDLPTYYRHHQPNEDAIEDAIQDESDERTDNEAPYTTIDYAERQPDVQIGKILLDYNNRELKTEGMNKRMLSSFRERMESQKDKEQHDKLTAMFLQKLQDNTEDNMERDGAGDNAEYMDMIDNLWQKYNKHQKHHFDEPMYHASEPIYKRQIPGGADYSTLGWSGVGYRKRSSYQPDDNNLYFLKNTLLNTPSGNYERLHYELNNIFPSRNAGQQQDEYVYADRNNNNNKRFPVAKRSSNFYGTTANNYYKRDRFNHTQNRTLNSASGTDPNVMKDLTNIFVSSHRNKKVNHLTKLHSNKKSVVAPTRRAIESSKMSANPNTTKQVQSLQDEPLNIKKKSIDWSNYFGIDRRKKKSDTFSNNNSNKIDNDWLLKRYNKVMNQAMKRNYEFPLNIFRNSDQVAVVNNNNDDNNNNNNNNQQDSDIEKKSTETKSSADALKIGDMNTKLENIEDHIIDEALRYTGAHEGDPDPKHVQQVKDKVISRLAAAYSLEKMRRALSEFKTSLAAQRYTLKAKEIQNKAPETGIIAMENNPNPLLRIERRKCISKECESYSNQDLSRNEIIDSREDDTCRAVIDRRCQSVIVGEQAALFYSLCKWHQFCYLCNSKNNQVLLTNCDVMFLSKADLLCQGDIVCQWAARPSVDYLRDIHDSAPMELNGHCDKRICESEQPYIDTDQATIHHR